jgi:hypothetical protein
VSTPLQARVDRFLGRLRVDPILRETHGAFAAADFEAEGDDVVGRVGHRWCRLERDAIVLGSDLGKEKLRIPLS